MSSATGGKKEKRKLLKNLLKGFGERPPREKEMDQGAGSAFIPVVQTNVNEESVVASASAGQSIVQEHGSASLPAIISSTPTENLTVAITSSTPSRTEESFGTNLIPTTQSTLGVVAPSATQSNVKEGLGIAIRFAQTLLKKIPECIEPTNPPKMALSLVRMIIEIKNASFSLYSNMSPPDSLSNQDIGDNKDNLVESLQETEALLDAVVGRISGVPDSEAVNQEVAKYRNKIEVETTNIHELTEKFDSSKIQYLDYEKYKKKVQDISRRINDATRLFMVDIQIIIARMTSQIHDDQKKASLRDLNPSKKADHRTVLEGQSLRREVCTEGTRVKILEDITNWADSSTGNNAPVFWLTGQAGSGKTTIAYTLAKQFEKGQITVLGANFLCSRQFEETRSLKRVLPTIAYQLAYKYGPYEIALHAQVTDKFAVVDHDATEQIQELLVGPWSKARHPTNLSVLIIIDALDEIEDDGGSTLLGILLTTVKDNRMGGLRFLVTSRTDPRIVDLCKTIPLGLICRLQDVPVDEAESDIKTYLDVKLSKIIGTPEVAELRNRASGLFIFAATVVRILNRLRSITPKEQIRMLQLLFLDLSSVSKDKPAIDQLYEHILHSTFSELSEDFLAPRLRILYSFLCSAERISTSVAAVLMDDDDEIARAIVDDLHAVLYIQDGRVFWYHASFPDFLFAQNRSNFRVGNEEFNFWCNTGHHHKLLAASCLRVMESEVHGLRFNMGNITSSYLLDSEHVNELSEHVNKNITPVLRYSSFHWARHLSLTPMVQDVDDICSFISDFLRIRVLLWMEAMNLLGSMHQCTPMLHLARQWVLYLKFESTPNSTLAQDLLESANFATYFAGSPASESTPHLYISSLATWKQQSSLSQNWKNQFSCIPVFTHGNDGNDVPLLTMHIPDTRVFSVSFSNNGKWIASGSEDGCVRIWAASTGEEVKVVEGHTEGVYSVAFSSDDKLIVSGSFDSTARIWDVSTAECLKVLGWHSKRVTSVAFSRNGMKIVSASDDKSICLWDVSTGAMVKVMKGHTNWVKSVAISGDGAWIASGSEDHSVRVWDTSSGEELRAMKGHSNSVQSVAFSSDDAWIASGSRDCSVRVWDALSGAELRVIKGHSDPIYSVAFSSNGKWIASASYDCTVRVWNASSGEALNVLKAHTGYVTSVAFSGDATRVVSGYWGAYVRVWNMSTSTELKQETDSVRSISFSSDGRLVLFGFSDGLVRLWDTSMRQELKVLKGSTHPVPTVAFSSDGKHIAWGSENKVWACDRVSKNAEVDVLEGHTSHVNSVALSKDGSLIVSASNDRTVRLWDKWSGIQLKVFNGHTYWVRSVAFSGDDKQIVSGSFDTSVRVWDVSTGEILKVMKGHSGPVLSVAFSRDTAHIVSGSLDKTVRVWNTSKGILAKVLHGHTDSVGSVAFSKDGTHIVSGAWDSSVRKWDLLTGEEINDLRGRHASSVLSVTFLSNDRSIASGSKDGSVIVRDLEGPVWYIGETNWIISSSTNHRLMWIPRDARVLQQTSCRILAGESIYSFIDFEGSMMGPSWQKCYTPTSHRNP